ncbi:MAG: VOC family protein [Spirochaetia bacterium]
MIIKSHPYLFFDGTCMQAMQFYKEIFDGNIGTPELMGDLNFPMPEVDKTRVLNVTFEAQGLFFMASDIFPGQEIMQGTNFALVLYISEIEVVKSMLAQLQDGLHGKLLMPLSETQWSAGYAKVMDPFGIYWDLHVPLSKRE